MEQAVKQAPFGDSDTLETISDDLRYILNVLDLPQRTSDGMHETIWLDVMPVLYKLTGKEPPPSVKGRE